MAHRKIEDILRELDQINKLAGAFMDAGREAGLHSKYPFKPPPPNDEVYYDPKDLELARKYREGQLEVAEDADDYET